MKKWTYILFFCVAIGLGQNSPVFDQGKEQYKAEKYQEAINSWKKVLEDGQHSAALYFNLGNAYYKLNQIGPSIYYYEKALQLDPSNSDIKNNLAFAQNAKVDVIEPLPKTFFAKWDERLSGVLNYNGWAWVSVSTILLFTILFLGYFFSAGTGSKRAYFVSSFVVLFVFATGMIMAFRTYSKDQNTNYAIVFAASSEVKSGPRMGDETSFILHEGTKVQVLAQEDDWKRIVLADGKDGWIPASDIQEL